MDSYDVLIVGSGIAGLSLGCALAGKGRRTCVLEARPGIVASKRGLTLQPNGLDALDHLGLAQNAIRIGARTDRVVWRETNGALLATLDYSILDHPYNYLLTIVPSELEHVLREEFARRGGILHESTSFRHLFRDKHGIRVTADRADSPVEISAQILVGADGHDSKVRHALHLSTRVKEYSDHYLFMLCGPVEGFHQEARQYLGPGRMIGFFPTHGRLYIFYCVHKKHFEESRRRGVAELKNELAAVEPDVADSLGTVQSWEDTSFAAPKKIVVESWVADRVALLGDAAHALNPSWAQGANLALQDSMVLANTIEECFNSNNFGVDKLKSYEKARLGHVSFVQEQAERTARLTATENGFCQWLGKRIVSKTGRNRNLMRTALRASCGLTDHFSLGEQLRFIF